MKLVLNTPKSVKSTLEDKHSDKKTDSCYFPGCRKDANCDCDICLESINATLDLVPFGAHRSTLTNLSSSKPAFEKPAPLSFDPSLLSTPPTAPSRALRSTAKSGRPKNAERKKKKNLGDLGMLWKCVLLVGLVCGVLEGGVSWVVSLTLRPALSDVVFKNLVHDSWVSKNLSAKLVSIRKDLEGLVDGKVYKCDLGDSNWEIDQDGLILKSYCAMYKSAAEEVIIWGWPLQTTGILTAGFSSRQLALLSGRIIEWSESKFAYVVREANSTWVLRKWSASAVQFSPNTWVIDYKQNMFLENPSVSLAAIEIFKLSFSRFTGKAKQLFWLLADVWHYDTASVPQAGLSFPT